MGRRYAGHKKERAYAISESVEVLFEDNHLLVLNKPQCLLTQPEGDRDSLEDRGKAYIKEKYNKPGAVFLHPAHRLDRVASGIVVFAKTSKALSRLNASIRKGDWEKTYLARVSACSTSNPGKKGDARHLEDYLKHAEFRAIKVDSKDPEAKKCTLDYVVLEEQRSGKDKSVYLLEIDLHTGRYHQIRAQLSLRGWPILGDVKYGGDRLESEGIALHHKKLKLAHPVGDKELEITAPLPKGPLWM